MAGTRKTTKKKTTKSEEQAALERKRRIKREVTGVFLISLGIFLAASLYMDAVGIVGQAISRISFGLFGVLTYVLPLILVALGILAIVSSTGNKVAGSTFIMSAVTLL